MAAGTLRIGIDARAASEVRAGRGRYVRELLGAMSQLEGEHELVLFGRRPWPLPGSRWRLVGTPDPLWAVHAGLAAPRHCDVLLATGSYLLCAAPLPTVAVVFDMVAFDPRLRVPRGALGERLTLPLAVRRAEALLCISAATRDELVDRFPGAAPRAQVVPLGVDPAFAAATPGEVPAKLGVERPYVLSVGTLEPRKNLPRLVEAFATLPADLRDRYELVCVGGRGWATAQTDSALAEHAPYVRVVGELSDHELRSLYAGAALFAYPSLAEGFGLPLLEAMAAGTAVLTSNRSSLVEVAADAAELVDPYDVGSIREGLTALLSDAARREQLVEAGRRRAAEFSWERTARETLDWLAAAARR
jgi:glycosyltransferase involved in cell wall biosynthesis